MSLLHFKFFVRRVLVRFYVSGGFINGPGANSCRFFLNLFSLNSTRKKLVYFVFLVSLLIANFVSPNSITYSLIVSVSAACVFDFFISILAQEQKRRTNAVKILEISGHLSELRNSNYSNFGYQVNLHNIQDSFKGFDICMCKEKAETLLELMNKNGDKPHVEHINHLVYCKGNNEEYLNQSFHFFKQKLDNLQYLTSDDVFQDLNNAVNQALSEISKHRFHTLTGQIDMHSAVTLYFQFSEQIELLCSYSCYRYVGLEYGYYRKALDYDKQFIDSTYRISNVSHV